MYMGVQNPSSLQISRAALAKYKRKIMLINAKMQNKNEKNPQIWLWVKNLFFMRYSGILCSRSKSFKYIAIIDNSVTKPKVGRIKV